MHFLPNLSLRIILIPFTQRYSAYLVASFLVSVSNLAAGSDFTAQELEDWFNGPAEKSAWEVNEGALVRLNIAMSELVRSQVTDYVK